MVAASMPGNAPGEVPPGRSTSSSSRLRPSKNNVSSRAIHVELLAPLNAQLVRRLEPQRVLRASDPASRANRSTGVHGSPDPY